MTTFNKEHYLKKSGLVGVIMYKRIFTDLKQEKIYEDKQVLNMKDLLYYLSSFNITRVSHYKTKEILRKIRKEPYDIQLEDLTWESFIVAKNNTYWRPYQILSSDSTTITVECCQTLSSDNNILYSEYDSTMEKKTFTIRKTRDSEGEVKMLLKLPHYVIKKGSNSELTCNESLKECRVSKVYHGTSYKMLDLAEYAPYNYYGNWFILGESNGNKGGESLCYMSSETIATSYLYEYEISGSAKILYFKEKEEIDYLFAHMMYFECSTGIINNTIQAATLLFKDSNNIIPTNNDSINSFIFKDTYTIRNISNADIDKYDYTKTKNLLTPTLPNPNFTNGYWAVIKSESAGDGDKGLAAKLCNYSNSNDKTIPLRLNINGWIVENLLFLMTCDPRKILKNLGVYIKLKPCMSGNPGIQESLDKIIKLYTDKLLDNDIKLESILFEDYIYVPKNKFETFRQKLRLVMDEYKKSQEPKLLYDDYTHKISENMSDNKQRLEFHKKIPDPSRFLVGGDPYYHKYLKYKQKYLKLKIKN